MGPTGTLLVGIACVLAQGSPEAERVKQNLTREEVKLIEQLKADQVCQQLDQYIKNSRDTNGGRNILMGCQSCLKTSTTLINLESNEK